MRNQEEPWTWTEVLAIDAIVERYTTAYTTAVDRRRRRDGLRSDLTTYLSGLDADTIHMLKHAYETRDIVKELTRIFTSNN